MTERPGPNVRRLVYLDRVSNATVRISEADGEWSVRVELPAWGEPLITYGATDEAAATAMIAALGEAGVSVPEPPDDFAEPPS